MKKRDFLSKSSHFQVPGGFFRNIFKYIIPIIIMATIKFFDREKEMPDKPC
jgi:hypothetical protein